MKPRIAIIGEFQRGKSTLINCLLSGRFAVTGNGLRTTRIPVLYQYGEVTSVQGREENTEWFESDLEAFLSSPPSERWERSRLARISLYNPLLFHINIIDTPGFDAHDQDTEAAIETAQSADFLVLLLTRDFPSYQKQFIDFVRKTLRKRSYGLILNCGVESAIRYPQSQAAIDVESSIIRKLSQEGFSAPTFQHRVNLHWVYNDLICGTRELSKKKKWTEQELIEQSGFAGLREKLLFAANVTPQDSLTSLAFGQELLRRMNWFTKSLGVVEIYQNRKLAVDHFLNYWTEEDHSVCIVTPTFEDLRDFLSPTGYNLLTQKFSQGCQIKVLQGYDGFLSTRLDGEPRVSVLFQTQGLELSKLVPSHSKQINRTTAGKNPSEVRQVKMRLSCFAIMTREYLLLAPEGFSGSPILAVLARNMFQDSDLFNLFRDLYFETLWKSAQVIAVEDRSKDSGP